MTLNQFRSDFAEFADTSKYPDALITFWLTVTSKLINVDRWGDLSDQGQELMTAHYLSLAARDRATAAAPGAIPGQLTGVVTAKSVDDVSVSYDVSSMLNADAGSWNQTTYGARYFQLARLMGAGGIQLL
jgi:hypothetical protein